MGKYIFSIKGDRTYLNGKEILVKGLRCSNALYSDDTTEELIANLKIFKTYGVNTISAFFMGNRYSDIKGYNGDATLNPVYAARMGKIIEAADDEGVAVMVGCLYWGQSSAKWEQWTQKEANTAINNTVVWLKNHNYTNVFIDVDNEGMARRNIGFDTRQLIIAGKSQESHYAFGSNYIGKPPEEADIALHFSDKVSGKPYIESEGTSHNAPGGYWDEYSRKRTHENYYKDDDYYNYIRIGVHTKEMQEEQIKLTLDHLNNGYGYMLASTWLQAIPPYGPHHCPGGYGTESNPGIRWWLEFLKEKFGPYSPAE